MRRPWPTVAPKTNTNQTSRPALRPAQPPVRSILEYFTAGKATGREVHRSPSFTAEVKNEWSYASSPPISLHGVERDNGIVVSVHHVSPWQLPVPSFPIHYMRSLRTKKVCLCVSHVLALVCQSVSLSVCDVMSPPESLGSFLFHLVSETVTKMC